MITKNELTTFIKNVPYGSSEDIANRLLDKYDITEKPLIILWPGDVFGRLYGQDTIVWVSNEYGFQGAFPRSPNFTTVGNAEKWILIARSGKPVKRENQFIILLDKNGLRIG